jgi:methyltransferase
VRLLLLSIAVFGSLLVEARRASRNEQAQRARGGIEPRGDVYGLMRIAYPAAFAAMIAEGFLRDPPPASAIATGVVVFAAGKALKWWAIVTLGPSWTFRIVVVPNAPLIHGGPYRWLRHPNYVGVVGELLGVALIAGAWVSGVAAMTAFGALLLKRIRVEERMLATASHARKTSK